MEKGRSGEKHGSKTFCVTVIAQRGTEDELPGNTCRMQRTFYMQPYFFPLPKNDIYLKINKWTREHIKRNLKLFFKFKKTHLFSRLNQLMNTFKFKLTKKKILWKIIIFLLFLMQGGMTDPYVALPNSQCIFPGLRLFLNIPLQRSHEMNAHSNRRNVWIWGTPTQMQYQCSNGVFSVQCDKKWGERLTNLVKAST